MSELSKYQRSKQRILEMMDQLKQSISKAYNTSNQAEVKSLTENLESLDKAIKVIDHRLSQFKEAA